MCDVIRKECDKREAKSFARNMFPRPMNYVINIPLFGFNLFDWFSTCFAMNAFTEDDRRDESKRYQLQRELAPQEPSTQTHIRREYHGKENEKVSKKRDRYTWKCIYAIFFYALLYTKKMLFLLWNKFSVVVAGWFFVNEHCSGREISDMSNNNGTAQHSCCI